MNPTRLLSAILFSALVSCSPSKNAESDETATVEVIEEETIPVWIVAEHHINSIPVTSKGKTTAPAKSADVQMKSDEKAEEAVEQDLEMVEEYNILSNEELEAAMEEAEYEAMNEVAVEEAIVPLDETQTVVSYNNKGSAKDTIQVVSNADGSVDQIVFAHKHHKDIYDVENGMTGKETKKLRRELKHMVKNGKVFLYSDTSNVMYMMDSVDGLGNEVQEAEVDAMTVQAIVWKDKKHHKDM